MLPLDCFGPLYQAYWSNHLYHSPPPLMDAEFYIWAISSSASVYAVHLFLRDKALAALIVLLLLLPETTTTTCATTALLGLP
jgi:hypothetical protein